MPTRHDILTNVGARDRFIDAVLRLDRERPGFSTGALGIAGPDTELSTWDLFTLWHYYTMRTPTPPGSGRNAAHRGPVFLPWHRWFLLLLELHMQRVTGDGNLGLPYWDWAADGDHPPAQQPTLQLWTPAFLGDSGDPVMTGPFAFDAPDPASFRVRVWENVFSGELEAVDRGLWRELGQSGRPSSLPTTPRVQDAIDLATFDALPYTTASRGFRNRLEGWTGRTNAPGLHNRVHVWIGGDMGPGRHLMIRPSSSIIATWIESGKGGCSE